MPILKRAGRGAIARVPQRRRVVASVVVSTSRGQLRERRPAIAECIGPLRRAVVGLAAHSGATARQLEDVGLAVSEALTNAVRHAYPIDEPGVMTVDASVGDGVLEVVVSDEGAGLPVPSDNPGAGLGLLIIARVTQRLELRESEPGVSVHMTFALG
jgi:serine/threonine-protein kinase RsbW